MMPIVVTLGSVDLEDGHEPYPIPVLKRKRVKELTIMRSGGPGVPGRRVSRDGGIALGYSDVSFQVAWLTYAQHTSLQAMFDDDDPTFTLVIDDGSVSQSVLAEWAEDGYDPDRWPSDPTRWKANFHLHVISAS